jgi:hypothetical protein
MAQMFANEGSSAQEETKTYQHESSVRKVEQIGANVGNYLDMVGVTGSIPVAPTIAPTNVSWRSSPRVFQADAVEERSRSEHHADG